VLDYDDRGHASTHLFAAILAAGELEAVDGRTLLRAYVLAREARVALDRIVDEGRMEGGGPGSRGWHSTGVNGPIASAMAAAIVLGMGPGEVAMAMAMAASMSSGLIAKFGTGTKPLNAGHAARSGDEAALLVRDGVDADPAAIDGRSGLFEALGVDRVRAADAVRERYGKTWDLVERGVRIKPWPSCTTSHAAIETAVRVHRERGPIPADNIERLALDLRPFMLMRLAPADATAARFNMAHGVLTALQHGSVTRQRFDDDRIAALRAAGAFDRVEHVAGSTDLQIELRDGSRIREPLDPLRDLREPHEIEAKYRECTAAWTPARQRTVMNTLRAIEDLTDVRTLGALLRAPGNKDNGARSALVAGGSHHGS
jgi:2-methylcitrate dehydratase PrpD